MNNHQGASRSRTWRQTQLSIVYLAFLAQSALTINPRITSIQATYSPSLALWTPQIALLALTNSQFWLHLSLLQVWWRASVHRFRVSFRWYFAISCIQANCLRPSPVHACFYASTYTAASSHSCATAHCQLRPTWMSPFIPFFALNFVEFRGFP